MSWVNILGWCWNTRRVPRGQGVAHPNNATLFFSSPSTSRGVWLPGWKSDSITWATPSILAWSACQQKLICFISKCSSINQYYVSNKFWFTTFMFCHVVSVCWMRGYTAQIRQLDVAVDKAHSLWHPSSKNWSFLSRLRLRRLRLGIFLEMAFRVPEWTRQRTHCYELVSKALIWFDAFHK